MVVASIDHLGGRGEGARGGRGAGEEGKGTRRREAHHTGASPHRAPDWTEGRREER